MLTIYGYSKCSTVKKTLSFLDKNSILYNHIDNVTNKLTKKELENFFEISNQTDIKKLFNTSGIKYRELNLKDKIGQMTLDQSLELLATDGMLVKRPLITDQNELIIGHKEEQIMRMVYDTIR